MRSFYALCVLLLSTTTIFAQSDTILIANPVNNQQTDLTTADEGRFVVLTLKENRSTGYSWSTPASSDVLKLVKDEYLKGSNIGANGMVMAGVGGTKKVTYQITGNAGTAQLLFVNRGPGGSVTNQKIAYTINVSADDNAAAPDTLTLTSEYNNGATDLTSAHAGVIVKIELKENASTAYRWYSLSAASRALKFIKEEYIPGNNVAADGTRLMGVPGMRRYLYEVTGTPGVVPIKLVYCTRTRKANDPTYNYTLNITR